MKAYVTSIGEKTTKICCEQLQRFGFEVVLLDGIEEWFDKYKRFIQIANENCIRIDADVIVNSNIQEILNYGDFENVLMIQYYGYDFYRNNVGIISPIYYTEKALQIIKKNINLLDPNRPETSAWRLSEINPFTSTSNLILGMHGFFQSRKEFDRALKNKKERKQMAEFDFELADKLFKLNYEKN